MYLPTIQGADPEKKMIDTFGGLNQSFSCADNEFADMQNMSGNDFPYLVTRGGREELTDFTDDGAELDYIITDSERRGTYDKGTGVKVYDRDGYDLTGEQPLFDYYYRGEKRAFRNYVDTNYTSIKYPIVSPMRGLIRFGNNVISYPYPEVVNSGESINKKDTQYSLWLESGMYGWTSITSGVTLYDDGARVVFKISPYYGTETNKADNGYKIEFAVGYSSDYLINMIKDVAGTLFSVGSRIRLQKYEGKTLTVDDFGASFFSVTKYLSSSVDLKSGFTVYALGYAHNGAPLLDLPEYSYIAADLYTSPNRGVLLTKIRVDANLLEVYQNRLWGTDTLGTSLYCSNATDFRDWEIDGTDAGGGYVDVPENAPWTAIHEYNGYLYAFKENKMYKIVGNTSLDYAAVTVCDIGCINHEAVCICDSVMYFLSRDGIYAFTGNLPVKVSDALATDYVWGRFAAEGSKMYCSLDKADGETEFIVYDSSTRLWYKEDDFKVRSFVNYTDGLYALGEDRVCYKLEGGSIDSGTPFSVTTKKYFYTFDQKSVTSAFLWLDMSAGATVTVEIAYDGGDFTVCGVFTNRRLKYIPIRLRYCDEFQIRISGTGFCRLKQIEFALGGGGRTIK